MKTPKADETEIDAFGSDVSRRDWDRYGAGHAAPPAPKAQDDLGRPVAISRRDEALPDDLYLEYRREAGAFRDQGEGRGRSRRFMANVAGVSIFGVLIVAFVVAALATSSAMPAVSPSPSQEAVASADASAQPSGSAAPARTPRDAHVGLIIDLPIGIAIPDRDQPPDDGTTVYLTGSAGGFAMDPGTGSVKTPFGGEPFANGVRRAVVFGGLWVSSWSADLTSCGPACWVDAMTYRLDLGTGEVTLKLPGTYLIGASSDGIWVGAGEEVRRLDAATGAVLGTTPWKRVSEPRVGCGALWSYTAATPAIKTARLDMITGVSGEVIGSAELQSAWSYGPTYVEGQCWMMNGAGGASAGNSTLVWIGQDGSIISRFEFPGKSIVTLSGEFWTYSGEGLMQRFEATSGGNYGPLYQLQVRPPNDDPKWLFSATRTLWMIDGRQLTAFDVTTGPTNQRG